MGSFRLEARAEWRSDGKAGSQANIPLDAVSSGSGPKGFSSDEAKSTADMIRLFDMADGAQALTVTLKWPYAHKFFPTDRSIDFLSIGVHESQSDKIVVTASGKDLRVAHSSPGENGAGKVVLDLHGSSDGITATKA